MLSPYRIQANYTEKRTKKLSNNNFDNNSHGELDVKRPRLTSFDLKTTSKESSPEGKPVESKNKLKRGRNVQINEHCLDEILRKND